MLQCQSEFVPEEIKAELTHGKLTCKPRFILYLEGEKVEEVDGADFTKVEKGVTKFIPSLEDWVLEENTNNNQLSYRSTQECANNSFN